MLLQPEDDSIVDRLDNRDGVARTSMTGDGLATDTRVVFGLTRSRDETKIPGGSSLAHDGRDGDVHGLACSRGFGGNSDLSLSFDDARTGVRRHVL